MGRGVQIPFVLLQGLEGGFQAKIGLAYQILQLDELDGLVNVPVDELQGSQAASGGALRKPRTD